LIQNVIENPPDLSDVNKEYASGRLILTLPLQRLQKAFQALTTPTLRPFYGFFSPGYFFYSFLVFVFEYLNNNATAFFKRLKSDNEYFLERSPRISDELFQSLMLGCYPFLYYTKLTKQELRMINGNEKGHRTEKDFFKYDPSSYLLRNEPKWHPDLLNPRIVIFHQASVVGIIQNNTLVTKNSSLWETSKVIALFQARFAAYHTIHTVYTHGTLVQLYEDVQILNKTHPRNSILYFLNNLFLNNHHLYFLFGNEFFDSYYRNIFSTSKALTNWNMNQSFTKRHLTSYDYFMLEMPDLIVPYKMFTLKLYSIIHKFIQASFPNGQEEDYTIFWQSIKRKFKVHIDSYSHADFLARVVLIIIEHSVVHSTMEGSSESSLAPFLLFIDHDKISKYSPQKYQTHTSWVFTSLTDILPKQFLSSFVWEYTQLIEEYNHVPFVKSYELKNISARVDA
jgi:hypothetical protein